MLVDVRDDGNRHLYALVTDPNGRTVRRDPRVDTADPNYQKLLNLTGGNAMAGQP